MMRNKYVITIECESNIATQSWNVSLVMDGEEWMTGNHPDFWGAFDMASEFIQDDKGEQ